MRNKGSIKWKIVRWFLLLAATTICVVVFVVTTLLGEFMSEQNFANEKQKADLLAESIDAYFAPTIKYLNVFSTEDEIQNLIQNYQKLTAMEKIRAILDLFLALETTCSVEQWYGFALEIDDDVYCKGTSIYENTAADAYFTSDWYDEERAGRYFSVCHTSAMKVNGKREEVISFVSPIYCIKDRSRRATFVIEIPLADITGITSAETLESVDGLAIVNERGEIIYEYTADLEKQIAYPLQHIQEGNCDHAEIYEDRSGFFAMRSCELSDWTIVIYKTNRNIYAPINRIMVITFCILFLVICFEMVVYLRAFLKSIAYPVTKMSSAMMDVVKSGDMNVHVELHQGAEFENLAYCFNTMIDSINRKTQETLCEIELRKQSEFALLMSQMHPHFIYNCLNNINMLIQLKRIDQAKKLTENLTKVLIHNIRLGDGVVMDSVANEIAIVDSYLGIQKIRYPDAFEFSWDVQEDTLNLEMPKLLIQPIVENAIVHGIVPSGEKHSMCAHIKRQGGELLIDIENDGIPFDRELMQVVNEGGTLPREEFSTRIGISNIRQRIRYLCGEEYGLMIRVEDGHTVVHIRLPIKTAKASK